MAVVVQHFVARQIDHRRSVGILQRGARVTHVEVELPINAEAEGVDVVIVLRAALHEEKLLSLLCFAVAIRIREQPDPRRSADDDLRSYALRENANAERISELRALEEDSLLVQDAIAIGVLVDRHAITFWAEGRAGPLAVVHALGHPHATAGIHVNVRWILNHWLGCQQLRFEAVGGLEVLHEIVRSLEAVRPGRRRVRLRESRLTRLLSEDLEDHRGTAALISATIVDAHFGLKAHHIGRQIERDHRGGVSAEAERHRLAVDLHFLAAGVLVDAQLTETHLR